MGSVLPTMIPANNLLHLAFLASVTTTTGLGSVDWLNILLVVLMSVGVNLVYAVARRKLTDVEKMRRYNMELKAFRSEMTQAMKDGDKQKQEKLKKKQQQVNKMQMEMSKEQLKPTLLFFAPLLVVYYLMNGYINCGYLTFLVTKSCPMHPLVAAPVYIPYIFAVPMVPFWVWYFICSFTFSTVINRLFGLTFDY